MKAIHSGVETIRKRSKNNAEKGEKGIKDIKNIKNSAKSIEKVGKKRIDEEEEWRMTIDEDYKTTSKPPWSVVRGTLEGGLRYESVMVDELVGYILPSSVGVCDVPADVKTNRRLAVGLEKKKIKKYKRQSNNNKFKTKSFNRKTNNYHENSENLNLKVKNINYDGDINLSGNNDRFGKSVEKSKRIKLNKMDVEESQRQRGNIGGMYIDPITPHHNYNRMEQNKNYKNLKLENVKMRNIENMKYPTTSKIENVNVLKRMSISKANKQINNHVQYNKNLHQNENGNNKNKIAKITKIPFKTRKTRNIGNMARNDVAMKNKRDDFQKNNFTQKTYKNKSNYNSFSKNKNMRNGVDSRSSGRNMVLHNTYVISYHKGQHIQISLYDFPQKRHGKQSSRQKRQQPARRKHSVKKNQEKILFQKIPIKMPYQVNSSFALAKNSTLREKGKHKKINLNRHDEKLFRFLKKQKAFNKTLSLYQNLRRLQTRLLLKKSKLYQHNTQNKVITSKPKCVFQNIENMHKRMYENRKKILNTANTFQLWGHLSFLPFNEKNSLQPLCTSNQSTETRIVNKSKIEKIINFCKRFLHFFEFFFARFRKFGLEKTDSNNGQTPETLILTNVSSLQQAGHNNLSFLPYLSRVNASATKVSFANMGNTPYLRTNLSTKNETTNNFITRKLFPIPTTKRIFTMHTQRTLTKIKNKKVVPASSTKHVTKVIMKLRKSLSKISLKTSTKLKFPTTITPLTTVTASKKVIIATTITLSTTSTTAIKSTTTATKSATAKKSTTTATKSTTTSTTTATKSTTSTTTATKSTTSTTTISFFKKIASSTAQQNTSNEIKLALEVAPFHLLPPFNISTRSLHSENCFGNKTSNQEKIKFMKVNQTIREKKSTNPIKRFAKTQSLSNKTKSTTQKTRAGFKLFWSSRSNNHAILSPRFMTPSIASDSSNNRTVEHMSLDMKHYSSKDLNAYKNLLPNSDLNSIKYLKRTKNHNLDRYSNHGKEANSERYLTANRAAGNEMLVDIDHSQNVDAQPLRGNKKRRDNKTFDQFKFHGNNSSKNVYKSNSEFSKPSKVIKSFGGLPSASAHRTLSEELQQDVGRCILLGYIYEVLPLGDNEEEGSLDGRTLVTKMCRGAHRHSLIYTSLTNHVVIKLILSTTQHQQQIQQQQQQRHKNRKQHRGDLRKQRRHPYKDTNKQTSKPSTMHQRHSVHYLVEFKGEYDFFSSRKFN